jgi:hypothetical protein
MINRGLDSGTGMGEMHYERGGALYKVEADAAPEACARAMPSQP